MNHFHCIFCCVTLINFISAFNSIKFSNVAWAIISRENWKNVACSLYREFWREESQLRLRNQTIIYLLEFIMILLKFSIKISICCAAALLSIKIEKSSSILTWKFAVWSKWNPHRHKDNELFLARKRVFIIT